MNTCVETIAHSQQRIAHAGGHHIGDLISWNAEHINVSRVAARAVFASEGFNNLITELSPASALTRAVGEVARPKGLMVRPFARPKGDTAAAVGVYVQEGRDGEGGDGYACGARARVDRQTSQIVSLPPEGSLGVAAAMVHAEAIAARGQHLVGHCETSDVSAAMVSAVKMLSGVPLRRWGGFYLLPPTSCARWLGLKAGLESMGVEIIRIELHDAPDNLAAAGAAAKGALEADLSDLMTDLEKATKDGMRQDTLQRRMTACDELVSKAELYRGVLAGLTDQITARVLQLQLHFRQRLQKDGPSFAVPVND